MITKEQIKSTGATFTPTQLADFLAKKIANYVVPSKFKVIDPACGEGELLLAMGNVLEDNNREFSLTGFDSNDYYLDIAEDRARVNGFNNTTFLHKDFLEVVDVTSSKTPSLFDTFTSEINNAFDIVIANPPYVRTQILGTEKAQSIAKKFNLKGRVDLYYPFLIAMTESLKDGGILGVITSNRYLFTKSGESVRKYLSENYEILEVLDLGDTKLFDAAVLPAIFIGRKSRKKTSKDARFTKIYESFEGNSVKSTKVTSVYDILDSTKSGYFQTKDKSYKKTTGVLKYKQGSTDSWIMLSDEEAEWISKVEKNSKNIVSDFFKVKVGIKSNADKVFISDNWSELNGEKPENELLKNLISQENIEPWVAENNSKLKVLYPHISVNGRKQNVDLRKFPNAEKYLLEHKETLEARKYLINAGRDWFELWVPHRPEQWKFPKLVFPDISPYPRFYFDNEGRIVNGNCYWIVATDKKDIDKLFLIQGVANSKLMTKYHDLMFNNKLYSGRRRYFSQYVEQYPLPDFDSSLAKEIIKMVKMLNNPKNKSKIPELETELENLIAKAYGVKPVHNLD